MGAAVGRNGGIIVGYIFIRVSINISILDKFRMMEILAYVRRTGWQAFFEGYEER